MRLRDRTKPRVLVPEVVQVSAMDCGPACLQALLEGFGISVSYNRIRDVCQTDASGTSLSTMEERSQELGLLVEQVMLPEDHLFFTETQALPAVVVVRLREQFNHFVVAWSSHGRWVQVMDPQVGRRWPHRDRFSRELYRHNQQVLAADWREWAGSEEFLNPLKIHFRDIGVRSGISRSWVETACLTPPGIHWD